MREFILENLTRAETLSLTVIVLNNIVSLAAALFLMLTYRVTYSGTAYSHKFNVSLGAITLVTTMIMSVISNNVALSLGMVGALSIIRFRTAVKDVRDSAFIFWGIALGIGCGVSQYLLIGISSLFLLVFFLLTRSIVVSNAQLLVIQGDADVQNRITAVVDNHLGKGAHLCVKNLSGDSCELVYRVKEAELRRANTRKQADITQQLAGIEGVKRVNLIEQQDDIAR